MAENVSRYTTLKEHIARLAIGDGDWPLYVVLAEVDDLERSQDTATARIAELTDALERFGAHGFVPLGRDPETGYETGGWLCNGNPCKCGLRAVLSGETRTDGETVDG